MNIPIDNWKHKTIRKIANLLGVDPVDSWIANNNNSNIKLLEKGIEYNFDIEILTTLYNNWDGTDEELLIALADINNIDPSKSFPSLDEGQLELLRDNIELEMQAEKFAADRGLQGVSPAVRMETYERVLELLDGVKEDWNDRQ